MRSALLAAALAALAAPPALAHPAADPDADGLRAARARMVADLAALRFDELGNPVLRWDAIPPVYAPKDRPHELLVVLVAFADRGFDRFAAEDDQGPRLAAWYQERLFDPAYERPDTLSHYYREQSLRTYHLQGRVLPPVTLSRPRGAYGMPKRPQGGDWRNDRDPEGLVEEALNLAVAQNPDLDWSRFDRWDPTDFDGDDVLDEGDGYLDHLVLIYAGGGQSSCQGLFKLDEKLTPNVGEEALATLGAEERECAERIWPHRFMLQKREGLGPVVEGRTHARGGAPLAGDRLWALDYNMQSEYTEISTFIHEFGHSLGLPDLYARTSSNSTGGWDAMSSTADPSPQNLSAWSRLMLGWLRPKVILPPAFGGKKVQSVYLRTLDAPLDPPRVALRKQRRGLWRAALVVLPPKIREVHLTDLPDGAGERALYSGQGNDMNRSATLTVDLRSVEKGRKIELAFDAWWDIEGGWDFAYLETSTDSGRTWTRRLPVDRRHMPAKHGHDGPTSLPGFTGLSGDLDGDGKNESHPRCDPEKKLAHGEDRAGKSRGPCETPTWVRPRFDLSDLAGAQVRVRWRYFTDMAAVMRGLLIDNVQVTGLPEKIVEDFEGDLGAGWKLDGFTPSSGRHTLLVPHFYLVEHRDPYATEGGHRYDAALAQPSFRFFWDVLDQRMKAMSVRPRPGVVVWYANGAYAWSENDPVEHGQGQGFLLPVDANPNELKLPGLERWYHGHPEAFDTHYDFGEPTAQKALENAFFETVCFVRNAPYRPREALVRPGLERCDGPEAPVARLRQDGRPMMYGYQVINELLPGEARERWQEIGELYDYKIRDGKVVWRLRDRSLRYVHTLDAPFALEPFPDGITFYEVDGEGLKKTASAPHPAVDRFTDADPKRWANPKLFFGGVAVPPEGLSIELTRPKPTAPEGAEVKVWFLWDR